MSRLSNPCDNCGKGMQESIADLLDRSDLEGCPRCNRREIVKADVKPAEGFEPWQSSRSL